MTASMRSVRSRVKADFEMQLQERLQSRRAEIAAAEKYNAELAAKTPADDEEAPEPKEVPEPLDETETSSALLEVLTTRLQAELASVDQFAEEAANTDALAFKIPKIDSSLQTINACKSSAFRIFTNAFVNRQHFTSHSVYLNKKTAIAYLDSGRSVLVSTQHEQAMMRKQVVSEREEWRLLRIEASKREAAAENDGNCPKIGSQMRRMQHPSHRGRTRVPV